MAKGTFNLSKSKTSGSYIEGKIDWEATADNSTNTSRNVVAKLYVRKGSTDTTLTVATEGTWTYSLTVNGSKVSGSIHKSVLTDWVLIATKTIGSIAHNPDGTKDIVIAASITAPSATSFAGHVTSGSNTVSFDRIPRASAITSAAQTTLGSYCSIKWTPAAKTFRYRLKFSLGSWSSESGIIHPNTTDAYTYRDIIPLEAAKQITNKAADAMMVTLYTYSDSNAATQVGYDTVAFVVTVPQNEATKPTVKTMSVSPVSTLSAPFNGLYIQGHSKVKAALEFETKLNASVAVTNITVEGNTYGSPYESAILNYPGKVSIKATVKDSRGFYGTNYREIEVIPYSKPYVKAMSGQSDVVVGRCDASGNMTDSGTYLKIKAKTVFSKVISNGVQYNYGKLKYRYRKEGGSYSAWETILDSKTANSDDVITPPLLNGGLDIKSNYQVQIIATDELYDSVPVTLSVPSDAVYMDRPAGGKGMGLGGYNTGAGILDIYWRTKARGGVSVFDAKGNEIPLDATMPVPRDQIKGTWDPNALDCGIYVVTDSSPLKAGETVIMYNGVLIQMKGTVGDHVKFQLTLPVDGNRSPMYRVNWYSNWSDWRSLKL